MKKKMPTKCPKCGGKIEVMPSGASVCYEDGADHYRVEPWEIPFR